MKILYILAVVISSNTYASEPTAPIAQEKRLIDTLWPDHYTASSYGYLGTIGAGMGYQVFDNLTADLIFGWTPKYFGGETKTLATRFETGYSFTLNNLSIRPIVSTSILGAFGNDYFVLGPPKWRTGYYEPTRFRYLFSSGVELRIDSLSKYSFWLDWSIHDIEIRAILVQKDGQSVTKSSRIGSLGFGVRIKTP